MPLNSSKKKYRPYSNLSTKEKIWNEAKKTISDKKKLKEVLTKSTDKLKKLAEDSPKYKELKSKTNILIRMAQVHFSGEYKAFSNTSLLLIVFGLLYFITPTDLIPDFIPAVGFSDDASVLILIYQKLNKDIEKFLKWSGSNSDEE